MLLLVMISAAGVYVVSLPQPSNKDLYVRQREAVAKYMAIAGVHAAIARLPDSSDGLPYVRHFVIAPNMTGKYTVFLQESGRTSKRESAGKSLEREYVVVSEGSVVRFEDKKHIVQATVRHSQGKRKTRILLWPESK